MTTTTMQVIEHRREHGQYDMLRETMIVAHAEHGRLLLVQGYGGESSLRGGAYRWEHGTVARLQPTDTIDNLRDGEWNESASLYDAVLWGRDDSRPVLHEWSGHAIRSLAESAQSL